MEKLKRCFKNALYVLGVIMTVACTQSNNGTEEPITAKINLGATLGKEIITGFQERIFIDKLIPLETNDSSLLGIISQVVVSGQNLFILDGLQNAVLRYDMNGRFMGKISHQGQGPQEYIRARSIAVANDKLYVSDLTRILQYDLDGGYLNTFRLDDQSEKAYQLIVNKPGDIIMAGSYVDEHMINVYDSSWDKIASYFPRKEELANMMLTRTTYNSLGFYNNGVFVTNYFDPTIYYIRDNEVKPLIRFDFGSNNLPEDFFTFTPEEQLSKFSTYRENSVMGISNLTVTDDWIICSPEEGPGSFIVFYDRKQNSYVTNQGLDIPYSLFFGKWNNAPQGYTEAGQYYSIVNSEELREVKETVARKEKDYLSKYEFLKEIVHSTINEGDNPWLVFYTLKSF